MAYSVSEAARLLGVSHTTIRRYIALGRLKAIGGREQKVRILISRAAINQFLKQ